MDVQNTPSSNCLTDPDFLDEDKFFEEVTTTPYEKVLKILNNVKTFLSSLNIKGNEMATELEWVIKRISSHTLYTYDLVSEFEELEKYSEDNVEIKQFMEFLSDFSEATEIRKRNQFLHSNTGIPGLSTPSTNLKKKFGTFMAREQDIKPEKLIDTIIEENDSIKNNKLIRSFKKQLTIQNSNVNNVMRRNSSISSTSLQNFRNNLSVTKGGLTITNEPNIQDIIIEEKSNCVLAKSNSIKIQSDTVLNNKDTFDRKDITSKDFDIHEFETFVGMDNVLPIVGRTLFEVFSLNGLINVNKLDMFLKQISHGYNKNVPYHNSKHAADVAQTVAVFLLNSNAESVAKTNAKDLISIISASLAHDIGHPGTNNGFQMNSYSEIALVYNDQSVLENFHTATFFKLSRRPDCNIYDNFSNYDYISLRKRIISLILSTDMSQHAKILGVFKNKVQNYLMNKANSDSYLDFIPKDSQTVFDDQQQILDYLIHTADLAHNSKRFKISYKWSNLLMEEFWLQGDKEKEMGLPVSFLCDRTTADIPKSQIGFIKGIITPMFEVLVNLFPTLSFMMDEIEKNVEEWGKLMDKSGSPRSPKHILSPRITGRKLDLINKDRDIILMRKVSTEKENSTVMKKMSSESLTKESNNSIKPTIITGNEMVYKPK